jgi:hypothetical protein
LAWTVGFLAMAIGLVALALALLAPASPGKLLLDLLAVGGLVGAAWLWASTASTIMEELRPPPDDGHPNDLG